MQADRQSVVSGTVYIVYIEQPEAQSGLARIEAFADREAAIAYLRAEYDRFLATVPSAPVQEWCSNPGDVFIAAGVVRTSFTSWSGKVVARELDAARAPRPPAP